MLQKLESEDHRIAILKIVVIGETRVGKSNLILRYTEDVFQSNLESTIGADLKKNIYYLGNIKVREMLWDTAGSEKYQSISGVYFKGALGAIAVYDITDYNSFESLKKWILILKKQCGNEVNIIIVGNKLDLEHKRNVNIKDVNEYCSNEGYKYFEVSAYSGKNISLIFQELTKSKLFI